MHYLVALILLIGTSTAVAEETESRQGPVFAAAEERQAFWSRLDQRRTIMFVMERVIGRGVIEVRPTLINARTAEAADE